ncbi:MAG TPA: response regulator [Vicinamibacterales bacterium]|jgi:CheY-like chemotaxis protein|nr:response regulator [Vicinamibacterales bacterium]
MDYPREQIHCEMPHSFDSDSFSELAVDADHMAAGAGHHEQRLAALIAATETGGDNHLLKTLHELCVGAREQRRIADTIRARLIGTVAAPHSEDAVRRPLVLIVDDSPDNRDMASMLLETSGFDTITASNGLEGVIVAHYTRPAVIIMDVAMPVLDGVQAARLLKASRVTQDVNVIAYTAKLNVDDAPATQVFAEVLRKPASPEAIVGVVQRFTLPGEPEAA